MPKYGIYKVVLPALPPIVADSIICPPISGPRSCPSALQLCARLMRAAPISGGPSTVVYGLATVSKKDNPEATTNRPTKKMSNVPIAVAGIAHKEPMATKIKPIIIPHL